MASIERLVTAGSWAEGGPPEHQNNVWLIGDDQEVIVVDPTHDVAAVLAAVAGRKVPYILLTHGHWDHVRQVPQLAREVGAEVFLHSQDFFLWDVETHRSPRPLPVNSGDRFPVAGVELVARHTPGHTPGSTIFRVDALGSVVVGDTLFPGGPGATRWEYSSFSEIITSLRRELFSLPDETLVLPGHGESTSIGAERGSLDEWVARGW